MQEFIKNYYFFLIALLSIAIFYALQYLTKGLYYFINENGKIRTRYLFFMAALQFFTSLLVTWATISAFSSEFLSEYETIKMTAIIIIGGAPFNITALIWVALKLEAFRLMKKRYGKEFNEESLFEKTNKNSSDAKENKKNRELANE